MDIIVNGGSQDERAVFRVGSDSIPRDVESATLVNGQVVIGDTATVAKVGDIFRAENGTLAFIEIPITAVSTNSFTIATTTLPTVADTFYILRPVTLRANDEGDLSVIATLTSAPIQYVYNGVDTEVEEVTATQANSRPLPVKILNSLVPSVYNEITLTYVVAGNGIGEIETVVFEQAGSTVATLTLSYDGSNRLSNVVRS